MWWIFTAPLPTAPLSDEMLFRWHSMLVNRLKPDWAQLFPIFWVMIGSRAVSPRNQSTGVRPEGGFVSVTAEGVEL
jgi:hypothetical protein